MGGGLESCCVGSVYGADGAVACRVGRVYGADGAVACCVGCVYGSDGAVRRRYLHRTQRLSRPPPIQKLGAENRTLQLNI